MNTAQQYLNHKSCCAGLTGDHVQDITASLTVRTECLHAPPAGLLVKQDGVALVEGAALAVLPAEAHACDGNKGAGELSLEPASDVNAH